MSDRPIRTFLASVVASGAFLLAMVLLGGGPQHASAATSPPLTVTSAPTGRIPLGGKLVYTLTISNPQAVSLQGVSLTQATSPTLTVTSAPTGRIPLGGKLVYTLTISNPQAVSLQGISLTHELSPALPLVDVSFGAGVENCAGLPCTNATVLTDTTALITVTYNVSDTSLLDTTITHTTTLSEPTLLNTLTVTGTTEPVDTFHLAVTSTPTGPIPLDGRLVYTLAISNPFTSTYGISLTHTISPALPLESVISGTSLIPNCTALSCNNVIVAANSTALITVTYDVSGTNLLGTAITHTTTLSEPTLLNTITVTGTTAPVREIRLDVTSTQTGTITVGDQFVYTLAISNPLAAAYELSLTQQITPTLPPPALSFSTGITTTCTTLPCPSATVFTDTTALVTVTYRILGDSSLLGKLITHTTTLSMPTLLATRTVTVTGGPVIKQSVYLPRINKSFPDPYAAWVKLAQPAGGTAVNYLYVSQTSSCVGPAYEQNLPADILAATNSGIYRLKTVTMTNSLPSWELRSSPTISASHIISTALGYFAGAFNQGSVLRSTDGGVTWVPESLPNANQWVYWLAASGERILAGGDRGLFIRENGIWVADPQLTGAVFSVAASGTVAYAVQFGNAKDTLWRSLAGGLSGTWASIGQLPGGVNFMQTLDLHVGGTPELLIGIVGNGIYRLGANNVLEPFSQGVSVTAYGLWRDNLGRVYAALREPGGLQRFAAAGGVGESLNALPGAAPPVTERLYTVNGSTACNIIATGSREGNVWLRRMP